MVNKQLDILRTFPQHPKRAGYEKELAEEQEKLAKMQKQFSEKVTEFKHVTTLLSLSLSFSFSFSFFISSIDLISVSFSPLFTSYSYYTF